MQPSMLGIVRRVSDSSSSSMWEGVRAACLLSFAAELLEWGSTRKSLQDVLKVVWPTDKKGPSTNLVNFEIKY